MNNTETKYWEEFSEYLRSSTYCDFKGTKIEVLAKELTKDCKDDNSRAVVLFGWVRDNIWYRVGLWKKKATETLEERKGTCTNKANVLVGMLRSVGIPAGFGIMRTVGQDYFGPIVIPILRQHIGKVSTHVYALIYLDGRWIKVDPSDDIELSESTAYFNQPSILVNFDGHNDAVLKIAPEHILYDKWPVANADHIIVKKPRSAKGVIITVANLFVEFLRDNKTRIDNVEQLEHLFVSSLRAKKYFHLVLFFRLASRYRKFRAKRVEKFWYNYMRVYDIINRAIPYREMLVKVLEMGKFGPGQFVLDAGSGTGNFSIAVKRLGCRVVSLDNSDSAMKVHKEKDSAAEVRYFDLRHVLPFSDEYFDRAVCTLLLHVFSPYDREKLVKELYRVVKRNGIVVLCSPSINFSSMRIFSNHLKVAFKKDFRGTMCEMLKFIVPTIKMFYYNFVLEIGIIAGGNEYLHLNEQVSLLKSAGFTQISETCVTYAESAVLNYAIKT